MRDGLGLGGAWLGVGFLHFLYQYVLIEAHRDRIHFDELDTIGVIHPEGARQLGGDVAKKRPVHAPVHFVQHHDVGRFQDAYLPGDARPLLGACFGAIVLHQSGESSGIGKGQPDGIELEPAFDIPLRHA